MRESCVWPHSEKVDSPLFWLVSSGVDVLEVGTEEMQSRHPTEVDFPECKALQKSELH